MVKFDLFGLSENEEGSSDFGSSFGSVFGETTSEEILETKG